MKVSELIVYIANVMPNDMPESSIVSWVNILEDTIYEKFILDKEKPTPKTVRTIGTDELSLMEFGYRWVQIYQFYICGNISLQNEEFGKANNYFML